MESIVNEDGFSRLKRKPRFGLRELLWLSGGEQPEPPGPFPITIPDAVLDSTGVQNWYTCDAIEKGKSYTFSSDITLGTGGFGLFVIYINHGGTATAEIVGSATVNASQHYDIPFTIPADWAYNDVVIQIQTYGMNGIQLKNNIIDEA